MKKECFFGKNISVKCLCRWRFLRLSFCRVILLGNQSRQTCGKMFMQNSCGLSIPVAREYFANISEG